MRDADIVYWVLGLVFLGGCIVGYSVRSLLSLAFG
jgi:hypothetical protein